MTQTDRSADLSVNYCICVFFQELLQAASDVMSDWLDKHHGAEVTDNQIFDDLPKLFEDKFHQDMAALNVWCDSFLLVFNVKAAAWSFDMCTLYRYLLLMKM